MALFIADALQPFAFLPLVIPSLRAFGIRLLFLVLKQDNCENELKHDKLRNERRTSIARQQNV